MAGWSTQPSDASQVLNRAASSVTNDDIERFWKVKNTSIRRHLRQARKDASIPRSIPIPEYAKSEGCLEYSDSEFSSPSTTPPPTDSHLKRAVYGHRTDWWTRSHSAFLNEIPTMQTLQNRYTAQYDVAGISNDPVLESAERSHITRTAAAAVTP